MIFDILVAYGRSNETTIKRLIKSIVEIEPKFKIALIKGLRFVSTEFDAIQEKIYQNEDGTFDDLALNILDCAYSIHSLVRVYPDARDMCQSIQLEQRVTHFYDNAIPLLHKNISLINRKSIGLTYLNHARIELIGFFRNIVNKHLESIFTVTLVKE